MPARLGGIDEEVLTCITSSSESRRGLRERARQPWGSVTILAQGRKSTKHDLNGSGALVLLAHLSIGARAI